MRKNETTKQAENAFLEKYGTWPDRYEIRYFEKHGVLPPDLARDYFDRYGVWPDCDSLSWLTGHGVCQNPVENAKIS